jgi:hypothetical protein
LVAITAIKTNVRDVVLMAERNGLFEGHILVSQIWRSHYRQHRAARHANNHDHPNQRGTQDSISPLRK